MRFPVSLRPSRTGLRGRRLALVLSAAVALLLALAFRPLAGVIAARVLRGTVAARLGLPVRIGRSRAGFAAVTMHDVEIGSPEAPLVAIATLTVPWSAAFGRGRISIDGPRVHVENGLDGLRALRDRMTGTRTVTEPTPRSGRSYPALTITGGTVQIDGRGLGPSLFLRAVNGTIDPDDRARFVLDDLAGARQVRGKGDQAGFGARRIRFEVGLAGLRPSAPPSLDVEGGYLQALPHLGLSGITGRIWPEPGAGDRKISLLFHGSYGGAQETLWQASGSLRPGRTFTETEGHLSLRAERFSLDKIREILRGRVLDPARTTVDASLGVELHGGTATIKGDLNLVDLDLFHEALASEPIRGLRVSAAIDATLDPVRRTVDARSIEGRIGDLVARLSGNVALPAAGPARLDLKVDVPEIPCAKLFASFPPALIPALQGFALQGKFATHLATRIDFADLDKLDLSGAVGIDGCRVLKVPDTVASLTSPDAVVSREVEVPPVWNDRSDAPETLVFGVGPDNPDFVPYENISVHVINAILTTEDSRFFKHHGFAAVSEFRKALQRNLAGGGFRLGASSITMQMVKNLLLSHEKTLSRKLQELFLVWYIEQVLSKERILELYLNAIEYGPRLFGIGPAARHYFGKKAADLTPAEAAFIASLLPNPKRRYVQYCGGALSEGWLRYVRRILGFMHERSRLTDDEYASATAEPVAFDLTARTMTESECRDWVKRVLARRDDAVGDDAASDDTGGPAQE